MKVEVDLAVSVGDQPSPYFAVSHLLFKSRQHFIDNYGPIAEELNEDKLKFTDIDIITQISEVSEI